MIFLRVLFIFLLSGLIYAENNALIFSLSSPAFSEQGAIPYLYTCDGENTAPVINWENTPKKTVSLVLLVTDPDAPTENFTHWSVVHIPPSIQTLSQETLKAHPEIKMGKNDFSKFEYNGPCPPLHNSHAYRFTMYALDKDLTLNGESNVQTILNAMQGHIISSATITAFYNRMNK